MHNFSADFSAEMKYQVGFSAFGGDSCVKRDGGTSLESGVRLLLMYTLCKFGNPAMDLGGVERWKYTPGCFMPLKPGYTPA